MLKYQDNIIFNLTWLIREIVSACLLSVQSFTCFFLGSCKTIHIKVAIKQNSLFAEPNLPQLIFIILISSLTMSAFTVLWNKSKYGRLFSNKLSMIKQISNLTHCPNDPRRFVVPKQIDKYPDGRFTGFNARLWLVGILQEMENVIYNRTISGFHT